MQKLHGLISRDPNRICIFALSNLTAYYVGIYKECQGCLNFVHSKKQLHIKKNSLDYY